MNTLARSDRLVVASAPSLSHFRDAWAALNARHAYAVLLATTVMTVVDWSLWVDKAGKPGIWAVFGFDVFTSLLLFSLTVLAWTAAAYQPAAEPKRQRMRLALAVVASSTLTAAIAIPLMHALGVDQIIWSMMEKQKAAPPMWLAIAGNSVQLCVFGFLFVGAGEVLRQRAATQAALHGAQREQAAIAREVLESRLAAMQAQVEPQFLFDTLVDIEALYQADSGRAADNLDRLITYLRVALPRLREAGSTVEAEIHLVEAYLDVVRALRAGRPTLGVHLDDDLRGRRFYPMLLLPLIQRAIRQRDELLPEAIQIDVGRQSDDLRIAIEIAQPGACKEDAELARVRERLAALYGPRATLDCVELPSRSTRFTMLIPDPQNRDS